ncbi:MAG TPA: helix-turn-helix domain-containing protein [Pseudonocardiaceae bacterium]|nr:helix-turn-helix domain-containing protein [Pseudonocardiaceae bacterium]
MPVQPPSTATDQSRQEPAATARVPIASLRPADSPRLAGEDTAHVNSLAASPAAFPPITVHRASNRVIDGMHRLRAAMLRGETEIEVCFYDGAVDDAFVLAVATNVRYGLPLSHDDRVAAVTRIIATHPQWSDRRIASVSGLSRRTVAQLRGTADHAATATRVGRDGRSRPVDNVAVRARVAELVRERPDASLREIARNAGVSPSTVMRVRQRLSDENAEDAEAGAGPTFEDLPDRPVTPPEHEADVTVALRLLATDPSLRFNAAGRALLRQLNVHLRSRGQWQRLHDLIPAHCAGIVAPLARDIASTWYEFAERLEAQGRSADPRT